MIPLDRFVGGAGPAGRWSWDKIFIRLPSQHAEPLCCLGGVPM
jgi:hypothetical protein